MHLLPCSCHPNKSLEFSLWGLIIHQWKSYLLLFLVSIDLQMNHHHLALQDLLPLWYFCTFKKCSALDYCSLQDKPSIHRYMSNRSSCFLYAQHQDRQRFASHYHWISYLVQFSVFTTISVSPQASTPAFVPQILRTLQRLMHTHSFASNYLIIWW